MNLKWLLKLVIATLAGCSPYLCMIALSNLSVSDDFLVAATACCGIVAGVFCRFWSLPGAALACIAVLAFLGKPSPRGDAGMAYFLGAFLLAGYTAGLLIGIPAGYMLRNLIKRTRQSAP